MRAAAALLDRHEVKIKKKDRPNQAARDEPNHSSCAIAAGRSRTTPTKNVLLGLPLVFEKGRRGPHLMAKSVATIP